MLGEIPVKWDKIFHKNTSSHLTGMDIFADFELNIVLNGIIEKYKE